MRQRLIEWLVNACHYYNLRTETLHLTVMCVDRYLAAEIVTKETLLLLGVACLHLTSKYREKEYPSVDELVRATDKLYTSECILEVGDMAIKTLGGSIRKWPTSNAFSKLILAIEPRPCIEKVSNMLTELGLHDYDMSMKYSPSLQAASAIFLAKSVVSSKPISENDWTLAMQVVTKKTYPEAFNSILHLHRLLSRSLDMDTMTIWKYYERDTPRKIVSKTIPLPLMKSEKTRNLETLVCKLWSRKVPILVKST